MTNEIKNATLNTAEDIQNLATALNVDNTFEAIPETFAEKVKAFNRLQVINKAKTFIVDDSKEFFRSIVCVASETPYSAIVADTVNLALTDSGNIEVNDTQTALVFRDFMEAKIALLASVHADGKPTKEDRQKALNYFYGKNGVGLMQCLIYTASNQTALDGMSLKKSADLITAYATIKAEYTAQGKENPFDGTSNRKKVDQLARVAEEFLGNFEGWQFTKYHFDALALLVATLNRKGVFTIDGVDNALQSFILVSRHAFNGIPFEVKDKAKILEKKSK